MILRRVDARTRSHDAVLLFPRPDGAPPRLLRTAADHVPKQRYPRRAAEHPEKSRNQKMTGTHADPRVDGSLRLSVQFGLAASAPPGTAHDSEQCAFDPPTVPCASRATQQHEEGPISLSSSAVEYRGRRR
jgi:hypothetical protein